MLFEPCARLCEGHEPFNALASVVEEHRCSRPNASFQLHLHRIVQALSFTGLTHSSTTCAGDTVVGRGERRVFVRSEEDLDRATYESIVCIIRDERGGLDWSFVSESLV